MRLKISGGSKDVVLSVENDDSLAVLLKKLRKEEVIDGDFSLKFGFPPQSIDINDDMKLLKDIGVRSGDKLTIVKKSESQKELIEDKTKIIENPKPIKKNNVPSTPHIRISNGYLKLVEIPDDNSCLFRSICVSAFLEIIDPSELRSVVADTIREDKDNVYSDAFLGKPKKDYLNWIIKPTSWGGAIEMDIISKYFGITIHSIDVETGRIDTFNSKDGGNFIILIYSGIHYDTVIYVDDKDSDFNRNNFLKDSEIGQEVLDNINKLIKQLNHKGYVTNTSTFSIQCKVCNTILKGEREASQHASEKQHYEFGEVQ